MTDHLIHCSSARSIRSIDIITLPFASMTRITVVQEWGWVLEMYGFAISCYKEGIAPIDLHAKMMSQPPWDEKMDPYYLLHYTYGNDYTLEGVFTPGKIGAWRFDKRTYAMKPPPRDLGQPPDGMKNQLVSILIVLSLHRAFQVMLVSCS